MAERIGKIISMAEHSKGGESVPHQIKFEGFTNPDHRKFVEDRIGSFGLPTDNLHTLRFINADSYIDAKSQWVKLGHFNLRTGEYALYKPWKEGLPPIAQMGTMVHELAHANTAFDAENDNLYGGRENRERALNHATRVASQTLETGVYINAYHKKLAEALAAKEINNERFVEETHAIMIETRFTNAAHLKQVEESQKVRMTILGKSFTSISSGVDQTLLDLLARDHPEITNSNTLNRHIEQVRESFMPQQVQKAA